MDVSFRGGSFADAAIYCLKVDSGGCIGCNYTSTNFKSFFFKNNNNNNNNNAPPKRSKSEKKRGGFRLARNKEEKKKLEKFSQT